ncbi:conserved hypothetical protein [Altererythrobacter sp. B11]|uniref:hypothetical protein n=1 Tax=Altererythrobacter sp. B11 TaxID=2060312 RepID=UPI000DC74062|nr:hypothetical protein [Altererythrobacter sp. B11]BBC71598.1 conserved hypothetical protein [Altererythrobacter sp. B11]
MTITARPPDRAGFAARIAARARTLAAAHAEAALRARRADPARWRMARLLWPLPARSPRDGN